MLKASDEDPTKVEQELVEVEEPRTALNQPFSGVAAHGNTPFSMMLISKITDDLYQGGCFGGLALPQEIEHVVSLYKWERYRLHPNVKSFLEVTMYDASNQGFEQVEEIARWVNARRQEGPVLVHCQAGLNRSSLIAGRALMLGGLTADAAINLLRTQRSPACLCNKSFEAYLRGLETPCKIIEQPMTTMQRRECILPFGHDGDHLFE